MAPDPGNGVFRARAADLSRPRQRRLAGVLSRIGVAASGTVVVLGWDRTSPAAAVDSGATGIGVVVGSAGMESCAGLGVAAAPQATDTRKMRETTVEPTKRFLLDHIECWLLNRMAAESTENEYV